MTTPPPNGSVVASTVDGTVSHAHPEPVYDPLTMLVTGEPVTELDDALRALSRRHRLARCRPASDITAHLDRLIDRLLDERHTFLADPPTHRRDAPSATPASLVRPVAEADHHGTGGGSDAQRT